MMETQAKLFTAENLKELTLKADFKKLEKAKQHLSIEEKVLHGKRCDALKQDLLDGAHTKALKGGNFHSVNATAFFEKDEAADIPLILMQLKYELTLLGYTVTTDDIFSHVTLQSYEILQIQW